MDKHTSFTGIPEDQELYRMMIENSRDGICITQNGKFKFLNRAFIEMLGYTVEELCDTISSDLLAESDKERIVTQHYQRMAGLPTKGIDYAILKHKNGTLVDIEFTASTITFKDETASLISARDITERKKIQERLEQSEQKYRNLIDNAHDGIIITQFGKFKFVNKAFCNMVEYTEEELIESDFLKVVAEKDKEKLANYHVLRMAGDRHQLIYESEGISKSGKVTHFEINTSFIEYNGHPATFIIIRDHTQHKILEENLIANEKKYRRLFEAESDAIFLIEKETGNILDANPAASTIYGYSHEEFLKLKNTDISAEPEKSKEASANDAKYIPIRYHKKKDGLVFAVEISAGITELENRKVHIITARDITERLRMQTELTESESKYRTLIEKSLDGIVIIQKSEVLLVNKAFADMVGYTESECLETFSLDSVAPEDRERIYDIHSRRMRGELHDLRYTATLLHKNGGRVITEFNSTTIEINGKLASLITTHDITSRIKMQEALAKSERKFRELADLLPQTVFEFDPDGNVTYFNKAGRLVYGFTETENGINAIDGITSCDRQRMYDTIVNAAKRKEGNITDEYIAQRKDGSTFPVMFYGNLMYENNQYTGTRGLVIDISERKAMEEALKKSERKFRELADLLPQTVYELDPQGYGTYLNKTGKIAMGFTSEEIRFHALEGVVPEDRERMRENMRKTFQEKRLSFSDEYTALRRDGSTFPAIFYSAAMIEKDQFLGTRGLIIDISERKSMEETLRKSEQHYRQVIQSLQEGLFVLQDEKFLFVNDAIVDILGYTVEEMTGQHFMAVVPPELRDESIKNSYRRRAGNGESWSYEFKLLHKDGKTRIPVILSTNLTELDGKVAVVGTAKDITDRIAAEEEIKVAHKRLGEINRDLEKTISERTKELTEVNTQLLKLQKENLQSQFDVLKQQVNPHFLFNSLNVLTSLIRLEPELAEKFTEHLSKVYRYVLENKDNELVMLSTELDFLDAYFFLLNIRFMGKICVNIKICDDCKNLMIIPLALQLLIENAIKHNSMSKKSPLVIDIFIDDQDCLNVINNLQERESYIASTGVGLENIKHRYLLLNLPKPSFEKSKNSFIARIPLLHS